jgi:hypothetical protein
MVIAYSSETLITTRAENVGGGGGGGQIQNYSLFHFQVATAMPQGAKTVVLNCNTCRNKFLGLYCIELLLLCAGNSLGFFY